MQLWEVTNSESGVKCESLSDERDEPKMTQGVLHTGEAVVAFTSRLVIVATWESDHGPLHYYPIIGKKVF